ncbi:hypothetical protein DXC51_26740 [Eisenbergiella massiliensis]|uniref:Uncharacterized protein n=1 Tax=Eisenbergiella massiliensis TaxID=1720294 RepID=A0A3E3HVT8_9FIRM|nr:hypothetical protein DXC51_26740 [Eisenbergiella massiliensis]
METGGRNAARFRLLGWILAFLNHFLAVCAAACVVNGKSGRICTEKDQNSFRKYVRSLKLCARYQKR